jgi:hypothetical protein
MTNTLMALALAASSLNSGGSLTTLNDASLNKDWGLIKASLADTRPDRDLNEGLTGSTIQLLKPGDFLKAYPNLTLFG